MYIREYETKNKKSKTTYTQHRLVESYRTEKGVRQRIIMHLGTLSLPKRRWHELATLLEGRISGQLSFVEDDKQIAAIADEIMQHNTFVQKKKEEAEAIEDTANHTTIDLNSVGLKDSRTLGAELVADSMWKQLNFDGILEHCGFTRRQRSLAKAVILGRLIHPASELETWRWFQNNTALVEMTEEDLSELGKDSFYEIGDLILSNKNAIEKALFHSEQVEFALGRKVFLYDLTNTHLEGSGKRNKKARYGVSKQKRMDCPLVALALIVDEYGFPVFSRIYPGNQSEPQTFKDVLEKLEEDGSQFLGNQKPVLIMDRGIATKKNIELLIDKKFPYTVVSRQSAEKEYTDYFSTIKECFDCETFVLPDGWHAVDNGNDVFVTKIDGEETCRVLVASTGRARKEHAMDAQKEERFLEDMQRLNSSFTKGNIVVPHKIGERIGRIKNKYPSAAKYYAINIDLSKDQKKVTSISWSKKETRKVRAILTGCYVLESTQTHLSAQEIWKQYMTINRVEGAFRDLKSELGFRPINHQTEDRTDSHLFISVLAYHILNSIEIRLHSHGDHREWKTIRSVLSSHVRGTVIMSGPKNKAYHIRVSGMPESCHKAIYESLKIKDTLKRKNWCMSLRL